MRNLVIPSIFTAVDQVTGPVDRMREHLHLFFQDAGNMTRVLKHTSDKAFDIALQTGIAGTALTAPIAMSASSAIDFNDKLADVAKTTGLAERQLEAYGEQILKISGNTRTTIDDLISFGEIAGQLGIATKDLNAFTAGANVFSVAMAKDYSGGPAVAIEKVSKAIMLYPEAKALQVDVAMTKLGSALNALGAAGNASAENVNDFLLRVGSLPAAMRPSIAASTTLGGVLEEMGINAEIGASGFGQFLADALKNLPIVAAQMRMAQQSASALLASDPTRFAIDYARLLPRDPVAMQKMLDAAKIGSTEEKRVLGALQSGADLYAQRLQLVNDAYGRGVSLLEEYNVKNNTTAGKLEQAKNNAAALSITLGNSLIPAIDSIAKHMIPVIGGVTDWAKEHKTLTKVILVSAGVIGGSLLAISAVSTTIGIVTKATWLWNAAVAAGNLLFTTLPAYLATSNAGFALWTAGQYAAAGATAYFSSSLTVLVAQIGAVTGGLALIIAYHDKIAQWTGTSKAGLLWDSYFARGGGMTGSPDMLRNNILGAYKQNPADTREFVKNNPSLHLPGIFSAMDSMDAVINRDAMLQKQMDSMQRELPNMMRRADSLLQEMPDLTGKTTNAGNNPMKDKLEVVIRNESGKDITTRSTGGVEIKNMHSWGNNAV